MAASPKQKENPVKNPVVLRARMFVGRSTSPRWVEKSFPCESSAAGWVTKHNDDILEIVWAD